MYKVYKSLGFAIFVRLCKNYHYVICFQSGYFQFILLPNFLGQDLHYSIEFIYLCYKYYSLPFACSNEDVKDFASCSINYF